MNELHEVCEAAYDDMAEVADEIRKKGGLIKAGALDEADKLAHTIKSLETIKAMKGAYGGYYDDGSERRSYRDDGMEYRARRRDSMGRYRDSGEEVEHKLREAMNMAPDDQSREAIRRAMEQVKR